MDLMDYRRKIIANSPHLKSASGDMVSFSDGAELPLKSLNVDIEPVQSGTGDPSPTNIRPISGWSAVKVTRTGKNLVGPFADGTSESKGITVTYTNNLITFSGTSTGTNASSPNKYFYHNGEKSPILLRAGVTYTASLRGNVSFTNKLRVIFTYESSTRLYYDSYDGVWAFTPDADVLITQACLRLPTTGSTADISAYFQLELGSTATPYEPYNGVNVSIDLGQTVYGGTLNPLTGVLTVDRAMVDLGTLTWTKRTDSIGVYFVATKPTGETAPEDPTHTSMPFDGICSIYQVSASNNVFDGSIAMGAGASTAIYVRDSRYTDASAFTTAIQGAQLCYKLKTPQTVQLTPHQIRSLYGNNTIFADTGNVALEYWAHP